MNLSLYIISAIYFTSIVGVAVVFICDYFNRRIEKIYSMIDDEEVL